MLKQTALTAVATIALLTATLDSQFSMASTSTAAPLALVGATLVDGTGSAPVTDAVVIVRDGRIDCAGRRTDCPVLPGTSVVDLADHWITPGLIDTHVHFSQTGWADGRPDALDVREDYPYAEVIAALEANPQRLLRTYLCAGVTAVFDVGGYPWTWDLPEQAAQHPQAPTVATAGPLLSTWDFWLNLPAEKQFIYLADEKTARDSVVYLTARGADAAKVWLIPTSRPLAETAHVVRAAGEAAREHGLPLIVHATGLAEAKMALHAGAQRLVHSVSDQPVDEDFLTLAHRQGVLYTPTLTVSRGYLRLYEAARHHSQPTIDDPNGCVDGLTRARVAATAQVDTPRSEAEIARYAAKIEREGWIAAENLRRVHAAGIPIAFGTDAGNPLTLHGPAVYAELEAMQAAGLSPMAILVTATRNGARAMRREDQLGTVQPGKIADLLVLAADPTETVHAFRRLRQVMRNGVLYPLEELRAPHQADK